VISANTDNKIAAVRLAEEAFDDARERVYEAVRRCTQRGTNRKNHPSSRYVGQVLSAAGVRRAFADAGKALEWRQGYRATIQTISLTFAWGYSRAPKVQGWESDYNSGRLRYADRARSASKQIEGLGFSYITEVTPVAVVEEMRKRYNDQHVAYFQDISHAWDILRDTEGVEGAAWNGSEVEAGAKAQYDGAIAELGSAIGNAANGLQVLKDAVDALHVAVQQDKTNAAAADAAEAAAAAAAAQARADAEQAALDALIKANQEPTPEDGDDSEGDGS